MKRLILLFCSIFALILSAEEIKTINLSDYIRSRYKAGKRDIVLPDGKVKCRVMTLGKEFKDLTIRGGKNTVLINTRLTCVFFLDGCKNVTLRDFAIDYDPLAYTQGTITKIDRKNGRIYYRIHDGYPRLSKPYLVKHALFLDKESRKLKYNIFSNSCSANVKVTDNEGYLQYQNNKFSHNEGDYIVLNFRQDCALKVRGGAEDLKFINITMYSGPGGIIARNVKGTHIVRNCRAIRGETPKGATELRLFSLSADAVNYATGRQGPIIEGNEFSFIGDDSVNLHGRSLYVVKPVPEKGYFLCATGGKNRYEYLDLIKPGDRVRYLAKYNYAIFHETKIKKIEAADDKVEIKNMKVLYPPNMPSSFTLFRIYVEGTRLPGEGTRIDVPEINMPNFVIRNNYFHDHRARGTRIMANNGIIENNRIENLEHQGISVGASYGFWTEAGWAENVIIRNNVIDSVCIGSSAYRRVSYSPGAICTFVHNDFGGHYSYFPGNKGIVIEGNRINNCGIAGIHLIASDGTVVRNNTISNVNWADTSEFGALFGIKYVKEPIGTLYSKNAVIENNKVIK